ncbi:type I toxin-antitoxin system SymE family toxin [Flavobacterium supellecticarium]|uniref:Type I toxin-antitoxin system SymE family toxin n=1 Tax=Flavobacterium supellecticarium TaxID=2565924 RepID=A0A4S4A163_9FLAO|nr:type I toxin-antitoxin system SymE family toxin [Flavobacterium supellecticarium]
MPLAGKWLQESGFKTGMKVKISCAYRKLIITVGTRKDTSFYRLYYLKIAWYVYLQQIRSKPTQHS